MAAADFAYSRTDRLVIKHLLKYKQQAITILHGATPSQHHLVYMATPNTAGGLVVEDNSEQKIVFGSSGFIIKPTKIATLKLHSYPAAMSLCFRASVTVEHATCDFKDSILAALRVLQVESTRQYEELCLAAGRESADALWPYTFYVRWTYLILTRSLPCGFNADAAFLAAAKTMKLRHLGASSTPTSTSSSPFSQPSTPSTSSGWTICFKCGSVNSHKSPSCPLTSDSVSASKRASILAAISRASITADEKATLTKAANGYYQHLDNKDE